MSNKNKSGIESFLKTQKLFNKGSHRFSQAQNRMYSTNSNSNGRPTASKGYHHYNLLNFKSGEAEGESIRIGENQEMKIVQDVNKNNFSGEKIRRDQTINGDNKNNPESKLQNDQQSVIKPTSSIKRQNNQQSQLQSSKQKQKDIIYETVYTQNQSINAAPQNKPITQMPPIISSTSLQKRRALSRQPSPIIPPSSSPIQPILPIQQQQQSQIPLSWQSLVTKSSLRYFQSCRSQALQYTHKLKSTLFNDRTYLHNSFNTIQSQIQQMHVQMFQGVKQNLYQIVDAAIDKWRKESMEQFNKKQLNYLAELYQLNTQVQERIKQIQKIQVQLDNQRQWKIRASDLLTANYQADLLELSRMVRRSTISAEENVQLYWDRVDRDLKGKFGNRDYCKQLSNQVYKVISEGYPDYQNPTNTVSITSPVLQTPNKASIKSNKQPPTTSTQQKTPQPMAITSNTNNNNNTSVNMKNNINSNINSTNSTNTNNYSFFNQQPSYMMNNNTTSTVLNSSNKGNNINNNINNTNTNVNNINEKQDTITRKIYTFNQQHDKDKDKQINHESYSYSKETVDNKQNTSRTRDHYDGSSDKV